MSQAKSGAALKTIRETKTGNTTLRLVQTTNAFVGLAIKGGEIKAREEGPDSDDVWRRVHDAASRLNPLFIGYSSARARFLRFFPDGFSGARYVEMERAYKLVAKNMLDEAAPLAGVTSGANLSEGVFAVFNKINCFHRSRKFGCANSCSAQTLTFSCVSAQTSLKATGSPRSAP
jgi:hypothetical protein